MVLHLPRSQTTDPLLQWLGAAGCTRVAIHFDVGAIDSNEMVLGLGAEPDGLTMAQVRRIVDDITAAAEVGMTVAELIPRQVIHLRQLLAGFPLIHPAGAGAMRVPDPRCFQLTSRLGRRCAVDDCYSTCPPPTIFRRS